MNKWDYRDIITRNQITCDSYVSRCISSATMWDNALYQAAQAVLAGESCPAQIAVVSETVYDCNGPSWSHTSTGYNRYIYFPQGLLQDDAQAIVEHISAQRAAAALERDNLAALRAASSR